MTVTVVKRVLTLVLSTAVAAGLVVVAPLVLTAAPAHAADNGEWSIFPKTEGGRGTTPREFFFYDLAPGQKLNDSVVVTNNTTLPLPLTMYAADAYNTDQGGGYTLRLRDEDQSDVGAWITMSEREIVVPAAKVNKAGKLVPGQTEVGFTLEVPRNASPGDHAGGVASIDLRPQVNAESGNNQLAIQRANGVRVYARISGPLTPRLQVTDIAFDNLEPATFPFIGRQGGADIRFTVANTGNVRINPTATLTITDLFGRELHHADDVVVPEILPGGSVTLAQRIEGMPALGQVNARIELTGDSAPLTAAGDTSAWSISWIFVGVIVLLLLLLIGYVVLRRRRPVGDSDESAVAAGALT